MVSLTILILNHVCTDLLIFVRYDRIHKRMKVLRVIPPKSSCWRAGLVPKLVLELIICSTLSPPGINPTFSGTQDGGYYMYSMDSLMNIIALLKSYLVVRIYWHYCSWNRNSANRTAKRHDYRISFMFAIKSELKYRPFLVIGLSLIVSVFYLGFIIRTAEL